MQHDSTSWHLSRGKGCEEVADLVGEMSSASRNISDMFAARTPWNRQVIPWRRHGPSLAHHPRILGASVPLPQMEGSDMFSSFQMQQCHR